jgi:hypothetical protein
MVVLGGPHSKSGGYGCEDKSPAFGENLKLSK